MSQALRWPEPERLLPLTSSRRLGACNIAKYRAKHYFERIN
jgi:hypothetical protein